MDLLQQAMDAHQGGDLATAEGLYSRLLRTDPEHPEVHHLLGLLLWQKKDFDQASQFLSRAIQLAPDRPTYHASLGSFHLERNNFPQALESSLTALGLNPEEAQPIQTLEDFSKILGDKSPFEGHRPWPSGRPVGCEASKSYDQKEQDGFFANFLSGKNILDIGFKGSWKDSVPIVEGAIGVDLDYPGYDGKTLPFDSGSQDAVYSSHCLEHVEDPVAALREWFRVVKIGGYLVVVVPHKHLYEKKPVPPSSWNPDHKRFYTPASLLEELEEALEPNAYRIRHLVDNDAGYDYRIPPTFHSLGCYEIELVIQKQEPPAWKLE